MSTVDIRDAGPPFGSESVYADVIFRSSDLVDFRILRAFLIFSSPVFADMFSLPQNPAGPNVDETKEGLPIVKMQESSKELYSLLHSCYPVRAEEAKHHPQTIEHAQALLDVSRKYMLETLERSTWAALVTPHFLDSEPLRVFTLAVKFGREREAHAAVNALLRTPFIDSTYSPELEHITGGDLFRMQAHRRACAATAAKVPLGWRGGQDNFNCSFCAASGKPPGGAIWFVQYLEAASEALKNKPWGEAVLDSGLIDKALQRACRCRDCAGRVSRFAQLTVLLAKEVDQVTSLVSLTTFSRRSLSSNAYGRCPSNYWALGRPQIPS